MSHLLSISRLLGKKGTIERALLEERFPRRTWRALQETRACYLIEQMAQLNSILPDVLLDQVCAAIGLQPQAEVTVPSRELVNLTGYSSELLHSLSVVPQSAQNTKFGYAIVTGDPDRISADDFLTQGIPVYLGLGSRIDAAWSQFYAIPAPVSRPQSAIRQAKKMSHEIIFNVLNQLLEQAAQCKATELFIGHPDETQYEFFVGSNRYRGKIKPELYRNLVASFAAGERRIKVPTMSKLLRNVSVALTRNGDRPVLLVSWDTMLTSPAFADQREAELNLGSTLLGNSKDSPESQAAQSGVPTPASVAAAASAELLTKTQVERSLQLVSPTEDATSASPSEAARHKVLLIDDDDRFRLILRRILESKGWEVCEQSTAVSALDFIRTNPHGADLIISDVHMPNMDGVEFLKSIKELSNVAPILMLTSDENSLLQAELALLGADAFVRKQDDPRVLLAWCFNLLARGKQSSSVSDEHRSAV